MDHQPTISGTDIGFSVKIGGSETLIDAKLTTDYDESNLVPSTIEPKFALEKILDMAGPIYDKEVLGRYDSHSQ